MGSIELHEQLIFQILKEFGKGDFRLWKNNTGAVKTENRFIRFGLKGSADILGIRKGGTLIAIEVKTGNARQSLQQKRFQKMIDDFGGIYILARSLADVKKTLGAINS